MDETKILAALVELSKERNQQIGNLLKELEEKIVSLGGIAPGIADQVSTTVSGRVTASVSVSGLKTSVGEISRSVQEAEKKAKNIVALLTWKLSLLLLLAGAGFVGGSYAVARYTMPDIPALLKRKADLERSIRVLSSQDPGKMNVYKCDGKPCVRVYPKTPYGQDNDIFILNPLK